MKWLRTPATAGVAGSLVLGSAAVALAPSRWELSFFHAFLLGAALYAGALRGYIASRSNAGASFWRGALVRAAAFLFFAATQAIVCFDLAPEADVRGFFVILSSWIVAETALG